MHSVVVGIETPTQFLCQELQEPRVGPQEVPAMHKLVSEHHPHLLLPVEFYQARQKVSTS